MNWIHHNLINQYFHLNPFLHYHYCFIPNLHTSNFNFTIHAIRLILTVIFHCDFCFSKIFYLNSLPYCVTLDFLASANNSNIIIIIVINI